MQKLLVAAALVTLGTAALANDSTASTGAGGLVLERTDAIEMASEDLYVSAEQIRIRYVFRNRTARDVMTIVAFPMPDRDLSQEYGQDVAYPHSFKTRVAGVPVTATLERKAMLKGRDYSALLQRLRVPIATETDIGPTHFMDALPPAQKAELIRLGLAGEEEYDDDGKGMKKHLIPLWTLRDKYWWRQTFPAGRDVVVEHRYVPGVGGSVESPIAFRELRSSDDLKWARQNYCVDEQFMTAVDRLSLKPAVQRGTNTPRNPTQGPGMPDRRIDYILTTGANWARPIGSFRLVVDKGKPGNLVSFCETGVKKISPTQYEVRHRNWRPTRDLHVLIIEPQR